ncbi:MAG: hypothetical protein JWN17_753 [Frankiales bacterium]|nr:hypothetical protein [Frankiales bacterium]
MFCSLTARKAAGVVIAAALATTGTIGVALAAGAPTAVTKAPATDIPTVTGVASNVIDQANAATTVLSISGSNFQEYNSAGTTLVKPVVKVGGEHIEMDKVFVVSPTRLVVQLPSLATAHLWSGPDGAHTGGVPTPVDTSPADGVADNQAAIDAFNTAHPENADDVAGEVLALGAAQDVSVTNSVGSNIDTAADDVTVVSTALDSSSMRVVDAKNVIVDVSSTPVSGSTLGGATLYLAAPASAKLQKASKVTIDGVPATILKRTTYRGDADFTTGGVQPGILDKLTIKVPAHPVTSVGKDILVATPGALQKLTAAYRFDPVLASASTTTGQSGDVVVLKGTGFTGQTFQLGSTSSPSALIVSDTEAVVTVPASLAAGYTGTWSVVGAATSSKVTFSVPEVAAP